MSHAAVSWALEQRLPALQKLVLLMLCHRHNAKTGRCDPSIQCIADDCGMSKEAVRTALAKLAALDLVTAEGRRQGERQISHSYHLAIGMIATGVVAETDQGSSSEPLPVVGLSHQGSGSEPRGVVAETDTNIGTLFNKGIRTLEGNNNIPPRGKREKKAHPLFGDLKERVFAYYRAHNKIDPPWDGGEARQLSRLLAAQPNADVTFWRTCLFGRHNSDVNHAERPRVWLANLASYHKPLNAYNRPKETTHARQFLTAQERKNAAHAEIFRELRAGRPGGSGVLGHPPGFALPRGMPHTGARGHIYAMKREALEAAEKIFTCKHRALETLATCRDCRGTGEYIDSYGHNWRHCRMCDNSGTVRLHFVESRIGEHFTWHTPRMSFPGHILPITGDSSALESGWTVNQPGRVLTISQACRDLMLVEKFFVPRYGRCRGRDSYWEYGDGCRGCIDCYSLYIGKQRDRCIHCGSSEVYIGLGGHEGRAHYTVGCCEACYRSPEAKESLHNFSMPEELEGQIYVREWIATHPKRERKSAA